MRYLVIVLTLSLLFVAGSVLAQDGEDPYEDLTATNLGELEAFGPPREPDQVFATYLSHFTRDEKEYLGTEYEQNLRILSETFGIGIDPWRDDRYGIRFGANVTVMDLPSRNDSGKPYPLGFVKFRPVYFWKFKEWEDGSVADLEIGCSGLYRWTRFDLPDVVRPGGAVEPTLQVRYRDERWGVSAMGGYLRNINSNQHEDFVQGRTDIFWLWGKSLSHEWSSSVGIGYFRATEGRDYAVIPSVSLTDTLWGVFELTAGYDAGLVEHKLYANTWRLGAGVAF
jgi:hypothetical protein